MMLLLMMMMMMMQHYCEQNTMSARIGPLHEATGYDVEIRAITNAGAGRTNTLRFVVPRLRSPSDAQFTDELTDNKQFNSKF